MRVSNSCSTGCFTILKSETNFYQSTDGLRRPLRRKTGGWRFKDEFINRHPASTPPTQEKLKSTAEQISQLNLSFISWPSRSDFLLIQARCWSEWGHISQHLFIDGRHVVTYFILCEDEHNPFCGLVSEIFKEWKEIITACRWLQKKKWLGKKKTQTRSRLVLKCVSGERVTRGQPRHITDHAFVCPCVSEVSSQAVWLEFISGYVLVRTQCIYILYLRLYFYLCLADDPYPDLHTPLSVNAFWYWSTRTQNHRTSVRMIIRKMCYMSVVSQTTYRLSESILRASLRLFALVFIAFHLWFAF